jgi:hypothetical protein
MYYQTLHIYYDLHEINYKMVFSPNSRFFLFYLGIRIIVTLVEDTLIKKCIFYLHNLSL